MARWLREWWAHTSLNTTSGATLSMWPRGWTATEPWERFRYLIDFCFVFLTGPDFRFPIGDSHHRQTTDGEWLRMWMQGQNLCERKRRTRDLLYQIARIERYQRSVIFLGYNPSLKKTKPNKIHQSTCWANSKCCDWFCDKHTPECTSLFTQYSERERERPVLLETLISIHSPLHITRRLVLDLFVVKELRNVLFSNCKTKKRRTHRVCFVSCSLSGIVALVLVSRVWSLISIVWILILEIKVWRIRATLHEDCPIECEWTAAILAAAVVVVVVVATVPETWIPISEVAKWKSSKSSVKETAVWVANLACNGNNESLVWKQHQ